MKVSRRMGLKFKYKGIVDRKWQMDRTQMTRFTQAVI